MVNSKPIPNRIITVDIVGQRSVHTLVCSAMKRALAVTDAILRNVRTHVNIGEQIEETVSWLLADKRQLLTMFTRLVDVSLVSPQHAEITELDIVYGKDTTNHVVTFARIKGT